MVLFKLTFPKHTLPQDSSNDPVTLVFQKYSLRSSELDQSFLKSLTQN